MRKSICAVRPNFLPQPDVISAFSNKKCYKKNFFLLPFFVWRICIGRTTDRLKKTINNSDFQCTVTFFYINFYIFLVLCILIVFYSFAYIHYLYMGAYIVKIWMYG